MDVKQITRVAVRLHDGTSFRGSINLKDFNRLSDLLNRSEDPFLTMFNVSQSDQPMDVVFVNKSQIMWAMPIQDES
jgi:hypothetical protein